MEEMDKNELLKWSRMEHLSSFKDLINQLFIGNNLFLLVVINAASKIELDTFHVLPAVTVVLVIIARLLLYILMGDINSQLEDDKFEVVRLERLRAWIMRIIIISIMLTIISSFLIIIIVLQIIGYS